MLLFQVFLELFKIKELSSSYLWDNCIILSIRTSKDWLKRLIFLFSKQRLEERLMSWVRENQKSSNLMFRKSLIQVFWDPSLLKENCYKHLLVRSSKEQNMKEEEQLDILFTKIRLCILIKVIAARIKVKMKIQL